MSALVDAAIEAAGLGPLIAARAAGPLGEAHVELLRRCDLLALGALADQVRADEVGPEVRVYTGGLDKSGAGPAALPERDRPLTGLELLREVAIARLAGPVGAPVRVDFTVAGLELAQIALGFGASELAGRIASKRGLPLAEDEKLGVGKRSRLESALTVKRRELEGFVRRAGRTPSFVEDMT